MVAQHACHAGAEAAEGLPMMTDQHARLQQSWHVEWLKCCITNTELSESLTSSMLLPSAFIFASTSGRCVFSLGPNTPQGSCKQQHEATGCFSSALGECSKSRSCKWESANPTQDSDSQKWIA